METVSDSLTHMDIYPSIPKYSVVTMTLGRHRDRTLMDINA